ncbi:MAG: hypothetical protein KGN16_00985 [Burkholderiales bacterium]|nr:hypothetical protein [Burkholderiales bacterium]
MNAIRVVAVGLFAAAVIMSQLSIDFFREWMSSTQINSFILAMKSVSPHAFSGTGMGATAVIVLALASSGLGLFLSAVLCSPLDDFLAGLLRGRFIVRAGETANNSATGTPVRVAG